MRWGDPIGQCDLVKQTSIWARAGKTRHKGLSRNWQAVDVVVLFLWCYLLLQARPVSILRPSHLHWQWWPPWIGPSRNGSPRPRPYLSSWSVCPLFSVREIQTWNHKVRMLRTMEESGVSREWKTPSIPGHSMYILQVTHGMALGGSPGAVLPFPFSLAMTADIGYLEQYNREQQWWYQ